MNDAEPLPPAAVSPSPSILPNAPDTFCTYLARQFIGKRGFSQSVPAEAAPLAEHCDILLSNSDGFTTTLLCLVDREAHPGKIFDMAPEQVAAVGRECLKYTARIYGSRMPVIVQIMEVGPSEADASQRARLWHFKPRWFAKVQPAGWVIDPAKKELWTNARFGGRAAGASFIRGLLQKPREDVSLLRAPVTTPAVATMAESEFPYLTVSIIAVLCALFAAEIIFGIGPATGLLQPSIATLIAFGGISKAYIVDEGQWTRLFSGPLLHTGLEHLALNCIALFIAGRLMEGLVGRAWFGAVFVLGALGGAAFSLSENADNFVSVGASGAVMALFAALLVSSLHFPKGADRTSLLMTSIYVLIPSMLPVATASGTKVDVAAHLGGALTGGFVGLVMLACWPKDEVRPRLAPVAGTIGIVGLALFAFAFTPLPANHRQATLFAALIPTEQFPKEDEEGRRRSAELVEKFPRDPRSHLLRTYALWLDDDRAGAEKSARAGLADEAFWRPLLNKEIAVRLHTALALILFEQDRKTEAKEAAKAACELAPSGPQRELLDKNALCAP